MIFVTSFAPHKSKFPFIANIIYINIFRIGNNYTNRKKNLIKEWAKTNTSNSGATNGGVQPPSANDVSISGSSRGFLGNDFAYPSSSGINPKFQRKFAKKSFSWDYKMGFERPF